MPVVNHKPKPFKIHPEFLKARDIFLFKGKQYEFIELLSIERGCRIIKVKQQPFKLAIGASFAVRILNDSRATPVLSPKEFAKQLKKEQGSF